MILYWFYNFKQLTNCTLVFNPGLTYSVVLNAQFYPLKLEEKAVQVTYKTSVEPIIIMNTVYNEPLHVKYASNVVDFPSLSCCRFRKPYMSFVNEGEHSTVYAEITMNITHIYGHRFYHKNIIVPSPTNSREYVLNTIGIVKGKQDFPLKEPFTLVYDQDGMMMLNPCRTKTNWDNHYRYREMVLNISSNNFALGKISLVDRFNLTKNWEVEIDELQLLIDTCIIKSVRIKIWTLMKYYLSNTVIHATVVQRDVRPVKMFYSEKLTCSNTTRESLTPWQDKAVLLSCTAVSPLLFKGTSSNYKVIDMSQGMEGEYRTTDRQYVTHYLILPQQNRSGNESEHLCSAMGAAYRVMDLAALTVLSTALRDRIQTEEVHESVYTSMQHGFYFTYNAQGRHWLTCSSVQKMKLYLEQMQKFVYVYSL